MSVGDKMRLFKDLYQYRELLKTNVKKEIRGKYKGSVLGVLWSFINPLLQVLVYAIVFPFIMRSSPDHFIVYLVIGIIPWNFFITCMNQGMITVRMNAGIIKKVYFPREILPLSVTLSGLVNFFISCIVIILFCIFGGVGPLSWHVILVPIFAFIQFLFTSGLVFAFSAINIYIKDTEYIIQFFINLFFYATPILYEATLLPERIRWILYLNPLTHLIETYRDLFMYHTLPSLTSVGYLIFITLIVLFIGYAIFKKLEKGFAEEV